MNLFPEDVIFPTTCRSAKTISSSATRPFDYSCSRRTDARCQHDLVRHTMLSIFFLKKPLHPYSACLSHDVHQKVAHGTWSQDAHHFIMEDLTRYVRLSIVKSVGHQALTDSSAL